MFDVAPTCFNVVFGLRALQLVDAIKDVSAAICGGPWLDHAHTRRSQCDFAIIATTTQTEPSP